MSNRAQERQQRNMVQKWRIRAVYSGKWWRERGQKGLTAIPHFFTLLNLAFGVFSIILTMRGDFRNASLMVIGSLVADGLDGRLARLFKADGEFGKELDSLADVVSFGTAPAILLYEMMLKDYGYFGMAFTVIFPMCGALRLARFNIVKTSGFFMGTPITAAGTLLSCLAFYFQHESSADPVRYLMPAIMLILSYLMVCTIPYPDFKKRPAKGARVNYASFAGPLLVILGVLAASGWNPWALVVIPLSVYVTLGPWLLLLRFVGEHLQPAGGRR
ncbi:MAG TPA: CDP-diacylglycerol--serine O-phosphatidyltransferase, partial [Symbiobacteriaceae bacterium]|nr:CDP-diacylglycerol--serine O-phosphatidyltransferase [Symbiobacteriaceae bacterium]